MSTRQAVMKDLADWLSERPQSVKDLAIRFPPGCTIHAPGHMIPSTFVESIGCVISYFEPSDDAPNGNLGVMDECPWNANIKGQVLPEKATIVKYVIVDGYEITPDFVREALHVVNQNAS